MLLDSESVPVPLAAPVTAVDEGSSTSEAALHESLSLFSQISLIRTLITTMAAHSIPTTMMDTKTLFFKRIAHHEDTQGRMAAMDAVLALLVRNAEVLAGMAHIEPHRATVVQEPNVFEEALENDFTRLSAIANPRRRKATVKANVKGQKVVETEDKGQKTKIQEVKEQKRKIQEVEGQKMSVQKEMDREKVKLERERIKSDKKRAKENAKGGQDLMQKDEYTLVEPGLSFWALIEQTEGEKVLKDIFPAIR
jgi:hypothetical protein